MNGLLKKQYIFFHWLLLIIATLIFIVSTYLSFRLVNLRIEVLGQLVFFSFVLTLYLYEKRELLIGNVRSLMYQLLLVSSIAPIICNFSMLGDSLVVFGVGLLLLSFTFPIVIALMTTFVSEQPTISNGRLTPFLLGIMSATYNFCQFALIS